MRAARTRRTGILVVAALVGVAAVAARLGGSGGGIDPVLDAQAGAVVSAVDRAGHEARVVATFGGLGAWVDLYDTGARGPARLSPEAVDAMAAGGVRTLYIQVARDTGAGRPAVADPERTGAFLERAHDRGLRVVGWYLPRFGDVDRDLAHLRAIARFSAGGQRFDGVGVDIEWTRTVPADDRRSERLVALSRGLRGAVGDLPVGAIVLPPVQIEVVNPGLWPGFPWRRLARHYDAWLPMAYWSLRAPPSGYRDAARYTAENLDRLHADLGTDAPVHVIGGVGAGATVTDVDGFAAALAQARARGRDVVGASLYDWASVPPAVRERLARALSPPAGRG